MLLKFGLFFYFNSLIFNSTKVVSLCSCVHSYQSVRVIEMAHAQKITLIILFAFQLNSCDFLPFLMFDEFICTFKYTQNIHESNEKCKFTGKKGSFVRSGWSSLWIKWKNSSVKEKKINDVTSFFNHRTRRAEKKHNLIW